MMTAAVASINGGRLLQPHIVSKIVDNNGNTVEEMNANVRRQVISEESSALMRKALEEVVSANGGTNAYVKGYRIGGKSGTAQKLVCNMITTITMIKMGRVKGNKMVNMQLSNKKLVDRGTRMLVEELGLEYDKAKDLLLLHGSVKKAMDAYRAANVD
jgi:N-acetylmuramic acid 6-phosphate (MurNAc-6-P) etherase